MWNRRSNQQPGHCRCIKEAGLYRHHRRDADFFGGNGFLRNLGVPQVNGLYGGRSCILAQLVDQSEFDEAHFWLNGYVNKQNCRIWSEAYPQVYVETPLHPEKLTVWCALWAGRILLQKR
ncbi:hypothetical protein TNCV_1809411 [Trichonephila clavipes]|nr:hypothetical protein TNCV_1809411 [Trichonephila clavipes]